MALLGGGAWLEEAGKRVCLLKANQAPFLTDSPLYFYLNVFITLGDEEGGNAGKRSHES